MLLTLHYLTIISSFQITPSEKSVGWLMKDFQSQHRTQYRAAHVYFTEGESDTRFPVFPTRQEGERITVIEFKIDRGPSQQKGF